MVEFVSARLVLKLGLFLSLGEDTASHISSVGLALMLHLHISGMTWEREGFVFFHLQRHIRLPVMMLTVGIRMIKLWWLNAIWDTHWEEIDLNLILRQAT